MTQMTNTQNHSKPGKIIFHLLLRLALPIRRLFFPNISVPLQCRIYVSRYPTGIANPHIQRVKKTNTCIHPGFMVNQRIIAGNVQFKGIAAGRGVGFTTGLLLLRKGLGMQETPIRPHSWHCRMQSDYQYDGNRKRPPVWRRHRGSLCPEMEGILGGLRNG